MAYHVVEGNTLSVRTTFKSDSGDPLYPAADTSGPLVTLVAADNRIISRSIAIPYDAEPGAWNASISVPAMGIAEAIELTVVWTYFDDTDTRNVTRQNIVVLPKHQHRTTDVVFLPEEGNNSASLSLPIRIPDGDTITVTAYKNNLPLFVDAAPVLTRYLDRTNVDFRVSNTGNTKLLEPLSISVVQTGQMNRRYTYKLWIVSPQILVAASMVEDHINKARIANIIPELEYTQADLVLYMYRGLTLFNQVRPRITSFNGWNMKGVLLDAWVICSCYYALAAQLQAEGALAFDFSGQSVNLNVDRSPSVESALGRIEQQIENQVRQVKALLSKAGFTSGDGSIGDKHIDGAGSLGTLTVIWAPTTKLTTIGHGGARMNTLLHNLPRR